MISYNDLLAKLSRYESMGAEVCYIGSAVSGAMIPCVIAETAVSAAADTNGKRIARIPRILIHAGIHAREYATTDVLDAQIEYCLENKDKLTKDIYFVPMVNIDGAELCMHGINSLENARTKEFLIEINKNLDFTLWKANLNAVDLNTNFDALWGEGAGNRTEPSPESFIGQSPASEPETKALIWLTKRICPDLTLSYHARGREIYWDFYQTGENRKRDFMLAKMISECLDYKLIDGTRDSAGGYKDYCIMRLNIPSFTVECFEEDIPYPIPESVVSSEILRHIELIKKLAF